jgi:hypothetical protein
MALVRSVNQAGLIRGAQGAGYIVGKRLDLRRGRCYEHRKMLTTKGRRPSEPVSKGVSLRQESISPARDLSSI